MDWPRHGWYDNRRAPSSQRDFLFSGYVNGYGNTQNTINTIFGTAGDTIDIYVGSGGNGSGRDNTGLEMTVMPTAVPEPASMLALGVGALGILKRRFKPKS